MGKNTNNNSVELFLGNLLFTINELGLMTQSLTNLSNYLLTTKELKDETVTECLNAFYEKLKHFNSLADKLKV